MYEARTIDPARWLEPERRRDAEALAEQLPPLPGGHDGGDGYTWMRKLSGGWHEVAAWGEQGWNLGNWPYVVIAHYDNEAAGLYGLASYCEGDLSVYAYPSRIERDAATCSIAVWYWRMGNADGPPGLPAEGRVLFYGPYVDTGTKGCSYGMADYGAPGHDGAAPATFE